jgi:hypothetical protein
MKGMMIPLGLADIMGGHEEEAPTSFPLPEATIDVLRGALAVLNRPRTDFKPGDPVVYYPQFAFTDPAENCQPRLFVSWDLSGYPPVMHQPTGHRRIRPDCIILVRGDEGRIGLDVADSRMLRLWTPEIGAEMAAALESEKTPDEPEPAPEEAPEGVDIPG